MARRGRPSLEDEFERTAKLYFETAEDLKATKKAEDDAYHRWQKLLGESRIKEKEFAAMLRALLEMNDRVQTKRSKEVSKLPANVISIEQRG